ncbi:hypothetical protein ATL40_0157 [Serinibacter salmoneus]|uniref:Glycoamylase-like domain-containing protein n=1 Tax=Serinibacter salmoneus TaxID=556530 RepID=A0A2A9CWV1_9MICO|nr:hypothetical protein ATL40_0157 [Serinibacter salmoneus]
MVVSPLLTLPANGSTVMAAHPPYIQPETAPAAADLSRAQREELHRYLADTYASLAAMTDETTGLPADNITGGLEAGDRSPYTSPTNIGGYLWSTVVAREAGLVSVDEARERMATTLDTVDGLARHEPSGMFYNWYDPATGDQVLAWPGSGEHVNQFLSSVDNGWLAAGLRIVASAEPSLADQARALYDSMNFGAFFDAHARPDVDLGLIRGGFWDAEPENQGGWVLDNYLGEGDDLYYTGHHYDTAVSETRIATYLGIANGQIPPETYYATWRTFPSTCDWSWQEQRPSGIARSYGDVEVFEGVYHYRGMSIVPGWGGSMFEALMPDMLVPEAQWGEQSWGVNHPLVVRAQKEHGLLEAQYGYWGFSPASNPHGGYLEYGVDQLGLGSEGYTSDGTTQVDAGFFGCREGENPDPEYGDGVVTPHASFLGLAYDPIGVLDNAAAMERDLGAYGPGGFYDAVAVKSGTVAERYLSLDQSMIVAAIGNFLFDGVLRTHFVDDRLETALRPVMAAEVFSSSAADVVPVLDSPQKGGHLKPGAQALQGTAEPGAQVTARVGDSNREECVSAVDADGAWRCEIVLAQGDYDVEVQSTNLAGIITLGESVPVSVFDSAPEPTTDPTDATTEPTSRPTVEPTADPSSESTGGSASIPTQEESDSSGAEAAPGGGAGGSLANTGASVAAVIGAAVIAMVSGAVMLRRRHQARV